jgi:hypothetical protein
VFGKQDNNAIELSAIVAGTGGFVINGELADDKSGYLLGCRCLRQQQRFHL